MDAHRPFLDNRELIERIVRTVGRRQHLARVEQEDFAGYVNIRLLENDCAVLKKFRGRSSMWTYLIAVIERHLLDFVSNRWGRWRPSEAAKKIGIAAVLLDRLVTRDGHTLEEAIEIIRTNGEVGKTYAELRAIWDQLATRGRPVEVPEDAAGEVQSGDRADDLVEDAELQQSLARLERTLAKALADLPAMDRVILAFRFDQGLSLEDIAKLRQTSVQTVHRRLVYGLRHLGKAIAAAGYRRTEVSRLIGHSKIVVSGLLRAEIEKFWGPGRLSKRDG